MATDSIQVTEGVGKRAATHSITEDAVVKNLQRIVENTPAGVDKSYGAGAVDPGTTRTVTAADDVLVGATGGLTETAPASDTASSGLNGRLQRIAQRLTSLVALSPASLGAKAAAASLAVTQSTEDAALTGALAETAPATDIASSGLNGRLQRVAQRLTSLIALVPASLGSKSAALSLAVTDSAEDIARDGIITETAPVTDTASSGLNGRLQRLAQRLTSLIALLPASVGTKTAAASLSVTLSSDGPFVTQTGGLTETPPGSDTASSGLNGRLQRIAQRLTLMISNLPTSLGSKDQSGCLPVTWSTQDLIRIGTTSEDAPAGDSSSSGLNGRLQRIAIHLSTLLATLPDLASQVTLTSILGRLPVLFPSGAIPTEIVDSTGASLDYAVNASTSLLPSSAATTNATVAKAAAGTLFDIDLYNANAALRYLKIYNKASAPTVGTDTPVLIFALKPTERFQKSFSGGRAFSTGISWALTTGVAIADTGAVGAAEITALNIGYA